MNNRRSDYPKRQLIPFDVVSKDPECALVCIDKRGIWGLLALTERMSWRSTWYKELVEGGYTIPLEGEFGPVVDLVDDVRDSLIRGLTMNCEDLINITVEGGCGCSGSGGAGEVPVREPPLGPFNPTGDNPTYPPDFVNRPELYDVNKCRQANYIVNEVIGFIKTAKNALQLADTLEEFAPLLARAAAKFGAVGVAVYAFALTVFQIASVADAALDWLIPEVEAVRADLVCALYVANSTSEATAAFSDVMENVIAGASVVTYGVVGYAFTSLVASNEVLNELFRLGGFEVPSTAQVDCNTCANPCLTWQIVDGTLIDDGVSVPGYVFAASETREAGGRTLFVVTLAFGFSEDPVIDDWVCGAGADVLMGTASSFSQDDLSGDTEFLVSYSDQYQGRRNPYSEVWDYASSQFPSGQSFVNPRTIRMSSGTPFSFTFQPTARVGV